MLKKLNKKLLMLTIVLGMTMLALAGCGGSSGGDQKELEGWLQEAMDQYNGESLRGYTSDTTTEYTDGKSYKSKGSFTIDTEKKIAMDTSEGERFNGVDSNGDPITSYTFYTLEDDKDYKYYEESYLTGDSTESGEDVYTEVTIAKTADEQKNYSTNAAGSDFTAAGDATIDEVECTLTNEGEEDGYIKIKEAYKYKVKQIQIPEEVTRESLMAQYGWTEDDLALVDGASEELDAYLEENAANIKLFKDTAFEGTNYFWLTKDGHKLVKKESTYDGTQFEKAGIKSDASDKFFSETYNKIENIKDNMEISGMSKEEAVKEAEAEFKDAGANIPEVKTAITVVTFLTGDECEPLKDLPEAGKTYKVEEYMK